MQEKKKTTTAITPPPKATKPTTSKTSKPSSKTVGGDVVHVKKPVIQTPLKDYQSTKGLGALAKATKAQRAKAKTKAKKKP